MGITIAMSGTEVVIQNLIILLFEVKIHPDLDGGPP